MSAIKATVIGAGVMGGGIAQVMASSGADVTLYDLSESQLDTSYSLIESRIEKLVSTSKLQPEAAKNTLKKIKKSTKLETAIESSDLVIEAIVENLEAKLKLFETLSNCFDHNNKTIFATNTSQFSITKIASATSLPAQVIGMHWFNPPTHMKLIEVIPGLETSPETTDKTVTLCKLFGKQAIIAKDRPGFLVNRALGAYMAECFRMLDEGLSSPQEIDTAIKLGLGHPMGPFELADLIGLDTMLNVSEEMQKIYGDSRRPSHTLRQMVAAKRLGKKVKRGFYEY